MNSVGERVGMQLTIMSIAILIGSPIAGAVRARPLGFEGAGIYGGKQDNSPVCLMQNTDADK